MLKIYSAALFLSVATALPVTAQATASFTITSSQSQCGSSGCTFNGDGVSADVTAFSSTGYSNTTFRNATTAYWNGSGLGVYSSNDSGSPSHSVDNYNGVDVALFSFSENVTLQSISIGWKYYDADISVLAYTGAGAPSSLLGKSAAGLLSSGWTLIGHYADLVTNTAKAINEAAVSSSYWLISAYNSALGSAPSGNSPGGYLGMSNDYFKVVNLKGTTPPSTGNTQSVPEPSTILMLTLGLIFFWKTALKSRQEGSSHTLAA
ncbi:exosortase-dependent surface protein XDP1 [Methylotuvimicrobium sp. KM1]|uniref:exosortase-dependent surface protein XDP1 n=1 Tax=Methylotuvimicrobium sp. KM1 TaxID=3377707 RepID=UPI0038505DB9